MGHLFYCRLKFWRQAAKTITSDEQSSPILRGFTSIEKMESKKEVCENHGVKSTKNEKSTDIAEENDGVTAEKIKFPLYVFPETMKTVDILYKSDNCSSRTEFLEKAIRFYCGYLLQNKPELVEDRKSVV